MHAGERSQCVARHVAIQYLRLPRVAVRESADPRSQEHPAAGSGDLHEFGKLGKLVTAKEAAALV